MPRGPTGEGDGKTPAPTWLLVSLSNMFFGYAGFSMVLPTLWPYLRQLGASTHYLAAAIAAYGVGEGLGGWTSGQVYNRFPEHPKTLLLLGMTLGLLGAICYVLAPVFASAAPVVVVLARFASGFDTGTRQTIEQTLIVHVIPAQHQTSCSSRLSSCATTGAMLGPTLGAPLQAVHFWFCGLLLDGNNGPGAALVLVCSMNIAMTLCCFHVEPGTTCMTVAEDAEEKSSLEPTKAALPNRLAVLVCYMIFFGISLNMSSIETMTPLLAQRLYGWGPCQNPSECPFEVSQTYVNLLLTGGGVLSLVRGLLMSFGLGRLAFGRELIIIGLSQTVLVLVNLGNVDIGGVLPAQRFVVDFLLSAFVGGLPRGPTVTLLSQIIGPNSKAAYMGVLSAVGAIPRVLGPFVFVELLDLPQPLGRASFRHVYEGLVPRTWLLYGSQAAIYFFILLCVQIVRPDSKRHPASAAKHPPGLLSQPLMRHR